MTPVRYLLWFIATSFVALPTSSASAQDDAKVPAIPFDGPEVFCYLLHHRKLEPVAEISDLKAIEPQETLVIVFGANQVLDRINGVIGGWSDFLERGGSLLIASDFADKQRLATLGVSISGHLVEQENTAYKGNSECPLLTDFGQANPLLMHGLSMGLATNRPSYLSLRPKSELRPLVTFPRSCRALQRPARIEPGKFQGIVRLGSGHEHYAVGTPFNLETPGRAVVLAGHGLFTNGMMLQSDNDNFEFAVNCLRWLGEAPDGVRRRHALFIVDGEAIQNFDVALKPPIPPIPPIPVPTIQLVNQLLHGLEREGFFVKLLRDNVDVRGPARVTLIFLTVLLLFYGAKKLGDQRHHPEAGSALLVGPYAPLSTPAPLLQQRYLSQVQRNGLWEEARGLARQWFSEKGGIPLAEWGRVPIVRPDVETAGGWWERLRLRREIERLWQLAGQRAPTNLSWRELVRLTKAIQSLSQAVQEGRLRFADCSRAEIS